MDVLKPMVFEGRWRGLIREPRRAYQGERESASILPAYGEQRWHLPINEVREEFASCRSPQPSPEAEAPGCRAQTGDLSGPLTRGRRVWTVLYSLMLDPPRANETAGLRTHSLLTWRAHDRALAAPAMVRQPSAFPPVSAAD